MSSPKRIVILGSTGSIGVQTLDVVASMPDRFRVVGLAAGSNGQKLADQAQAFGNPRTWLFSDSGVDGLVEAATLPEADLVVVSVAGVVGLLPSLEALKAGKRVALASKEVLVAAGELVMPLVKPDRSNLLPIDSEHSAILQCLQGYPAEQVAQLLITASGGPFRGWNRDAMEKVTVEQALKHPTWRMGGKITIDSATLMNKALEMIEARWLFDVPMDRVDAVIHPQSIIHSMVRFTDGSVVGQMGWPNMRLPIVIALTYPEKPANDLKRWDPVDSPLLTFEKIDHETFPAIDLARKAMLVGGTMPCVFNAANEVAANAFLSGGVRFLGIAEVVAETMNRLRPQNASLDNLLQADAEARAIARDLISQSRR